MSVIDDGGSAFPLLHPSEGWNACGGMSLRDYFAAQALLVGLAAELREAFPTTDHVLSVIANRSYAVADAMVMARKQPHRPDGAAAVHP